MGSKKRRNNNQDTRVYVPIFIPTTDGVGDLILGTGEVRGQTLVVTFNDLLPAEAIRRRIEAGELTGITFTIPEDEAEAAEKSEGDIQARQDAERLAKGEMTERDKRDLELLDTLEE